MTKTCNGEKLSEDLRRRLIHGYYAWGSYVVAQIIAWHPADWRRLKGDLPWCVGEEAAHLDADSCNLDFF